MDMDLESPAYRDRGTMPARLATTQVPGGRNLSVPLEWRGDPDRTRSFVLAMIDHHPVAHDWVHWLVVDVPRDVHQLPEGASLRASMPPGALELPNASGRHGYGGPQPPVGSGAHDYVLTLYALDVPRAGVGPDATWDDVEQAMRGHVLDSAILLGRFGR
jgi:Raf kinase inhibitor-like YbhB/YbcL family protein